MFFESKLHWLVDSNCLSGCVLCYVQSMATRKVQSAGDRVYSSIVGESHIAEQVVGCCPEQDVRG